SARQYANHPDFGKYKKYLPPLTTTGNNYRVHIVGAMVENDEDIELRKSVPESSFANAVKLLSGTFDSFFLHTTVKVSEEPMEPLSLKLKRFVGRLEVNIIDEIPVDAHRIEVRMEDAAQYFLLHDSRGYAYSPTEAQDTVKYKMEKSVFLSPEDAGTTNYSF